ncbi:ribosome maturation factor RimP [Egicoccus halophilus]|uniref:Ribosome maturation factor RimP n=1 Tax=Egicoccus halophilus TaxID=1670830 RepID=A0A8J3EU66_9ACTN|nr:ribosome maturation factor RimP [Egicoccus halophilus]GGI06520.1 ribosome maturation factor RimP [Egicoccus halophilus]
MATTDEARLPERVRELASPLADDLDVELVDVEVKGSGTRRLVRLVADAEGGLDVDVIAALSRRVGSALDERDLIPSSYTLEVTSPGVDRPLRRPRDFARNVGREVRLVREQDAPGDREVTGTVVVADDSSVTLEVDGDEVVVPLADIDHGKVVLPW